MTPVSPVLSPHPCDRGQEAVVHFGQTRSYTDQLLLAPRGGL